MFRASVITILFASILCAQNSLAQASATTSCADYVKTFNVFKQKVSGKIVKKHTISELSDWSHNGQFEGFLLTDKAPEKVSVIIESQPNLLLKSVVTKGLKVAQWSRDKKYREVIYDPIKYLGDAPTQGGSYTFKLISEGREICSEKKSIINDSH